LLALGILGAAGFWTASHHPLGARLLREVIADSSRRIAQPKHRPNPSLWNPRAINATWLGHASVLVNFFGLTLLTDPVLFRRVGADLRIGTLGPKRLVAPALTVAQLPPIDLVLLSHAHMDHLDVPTLRCLPPGAQVVLAPGTSDLLTRTHFGRRTELAWGQQTHLETAHGPVRIRAFEVNHWGARWRRDTHRGYNGYVIEREGRRILFGGDTALSPAFKPLRSRVPFDLAIMPIGAYKPWLCSHCTPEQAVRMADEAGAHYILPIHHLTFPLGHERRSEPIERLQAVLDEDRLGWREVGQTFHVA
jgi:L-ascorbate metabolism protein UlaG (beta-lactamase superfamily)